MRSTLALIALLCAFATESAGQITVSDRFGRSLQSSALRLVDWEGYIANPAVPFSINVPEEWRPATVEIAGNSERLQFADRRLPRSEPATVGNNGPTLTLLVEKGQVIDPIYLTIWPDRDTKDEAYVLWIGVHTTGAGLKSMRLPVLVDDQDQDRPLDFQIHVETSQDASGFYSNPAVVEETRRAADDWAYFLSDNDLDEIPRGASRSWIWNKDGFMSGYWVTNPVAFRGFFLYAWGMQNVGLFSGGAASGQFQTRNGWPIHLMSGGHVAMETRGNHNVLGWAFHPSERDWWKTQNLGREANDFYSIVHHEIGHALFFSSGHVRWDSLKAVGGSTAREVLDYLGGPAIVDRYDHIYDRGNQEFIVDPASRRGVFGSEYASGMGIMAPHRWIITKTDLLMARQVGYELRPTSAFREIAVHGAPPIMSVGAPLTVPLVSGGVPAYLVEVIDGTVPPGLQVNSVTGTLEGTLTQAGSFSFTVRATDQLGRSAEGVVSVNAGSTLSTDAIAELPGQLSLSNHPNPVSSTTLFTFETGTTGGVSLEIYDVQGRRMDVVHSGVLVAGRHDLAWQPRDLPGGLYLARLLGPNRTETRPVVVVR